MKIKYFGIVIAIVLLFSSCKKVNQPIDISTKDYHNVVDKLTEVMVHDIFSPPVASRIYVYPNIAAYETLNQNSKEYKSLVDQFKTCFYNFVFKCC